MVRQPVLDLGLEMASRDVDGVDERTLLVFVGLAHVEYDGLAVSDPLGRCGGVDLGDLALRRCQQFAE